MITIATNENNDLFVDASGNIATAKDADALAQTVYHVDKTNLGECPLNTTIGTDFFGTIFASPANIKGFIKQSTLQTEALEGVNAVTDFSYDIGAESEDGKRTFKYEKRISTIFGDFKTNG